MAHHIPAVITGLFAIALAWVGGSDRSRIHGASPIYVGLSVVLMLLALFVEGY